MWRAVPAAHAKTKAASDAGLHQPEFRRRRRFRIFESATSEDIMFGSKTAFQIFVLGSAIALTPILP